MAVASTEPYIHSGLAAPARAGSLDDLVARKVDLILLLARLAMAYIFIESAITHAMNIPGFAKTFNNFQMPEAMGIPVATLAVIVELLGGVALALGFRLRETCVLMIVFVLVTIFIGHRFWELEGPARRLHVVQIKKNVAIIGGFLALMVTGGGRYALSAWMARNKA
jgi:putative oxidoreductase